MNKMTFFIAVLIITIFLGREADGDDSHLQVEVKGPPSPPFSCGSSTALSVVFAEFVLKSGGQDVTYKQTTASDEDVDFFVANATEVTTNSDFLSCAKEAARTASLVFELSATLVCTLFSVSGCGLRNPGGDRTLYVRSDVSLAPPKIVSFDEAPYENITIGGSQAKQYSLAGAVLNWVAIDAEEVDDITAEELDAAANGNYTVTTDGKHYVFNMYSMDVKNCIVDKCSDASLIMEGNDDTFQNYTVTKLYFSELCGKTMDRRDYDADVLAIYSHPGFGCLHYPTSTEIDCAVDVTGLHATPGWSLPGVPRFLFDLADGIGGCGGLTLDGQLNDMIFPLDLCVALHDEEDQRNVIGMLRENDTLTITLRGSTDREAGGFYFLF